MVVGRTTLSPVSALIGHEVQMRRPEISQLIEKCSEISANGVEDALLVIDQIHLVDRNENVANTEQRGNTGVTAGLGEHAFTRINQDNGERSW